MSIPVHAAFIMDGNGRWAKSKGLPRMYGHKRGLDTAEKVIDYARNKGIKYLSLSAVASCEDVLTELTGISYDDLEDGGGADG